MVVWNQPEGPYEDFAEAGMHATLTYDRIASAGPPARPLEFPTPSVHRGARCSLVAVDHRTGRLYPVKNVLMRLSPNSHPPNRAYLIKKTLSKSVYGVIKSAVVLKRRNIPQDAKRRHPHAGVIRDEDAEWESTEELAVIKASSWAKIRHLRGRHLEDPIKEISALQLVGNYHPNTVGALDVIQDDEYLYTVMPMCSGGDLFDRVMRTDRKKASSSLPPGSGRLTPDSVSHGIDEDQARLWFKQLLAALFHLQKKGVCHRDISLDNIMVDESDRLVLIDLGMSLRVPYTDPSNMGCITDVSEGAERRLIHPQGQGGKLMYLAPEVVASDNFDGFAIDLWAAGVVLFVLLVGLAPFKWAHTSDKRYAKISKGSLRELMHGLNIPLSDEACDLLQNMFWRDPHKRLTLAQVMQHPWVLNKKLSSTPRAKTHQPLQSAMRVAPVYE